MKIFEFRRIHNQCDREDDQPYQIEKECTKCGLTTDLGVWCSPKEAPVLFYTICTWCDADIEGLSEWLVEQFRIHVENSPDLYEPMPDGKGRSKEQQF